MVNSLICNDLDHLGWSQNSIKKALLLKSSKIFSLVSPNFKIAKKNTNSDKLRSFLFLTGKFTILNNDGLALLLAFEQKHSWTLVPGFHKGEK